MDTNAALPNAPCAPADCTAGAAARLESAWGRGLAGKQTPGWDRLYLRFEPVARLDRVVAAAASPREGALGRLGRSGRVAMFMAWQRASVVGGHSDAVLVLGRREAQAIAALCEGRGLRWVDNAGLRRHEPIDS